MSTPFARFATLFVLGASIALVAPSLACADGIVKVSPEAREFRIGDIRVAALRDSRFEFANDGRTFGLGIPPERVADTLRAGGATGALYLEVDALLVRTGDRVVVIDTGLGKRFDGALVRSLALVGVLPAQVTDVLITHAHGDHIGGLAAADGTLTFPNATVRMSKDEWAWASAHPDANHPDAVAIVAAITPKVRAFAPGEELAPGVRSVNLAGHTPGHAGYEIASKGKRLLAFGDTAHHYVISLAHPEWPVAFDADAAAAGRTRAATLARLAKSGELVWSAHYPFPGVGRVVKSGGGYAWRATVTATAAAP
jgi:glyoxylase-like metal-dependent hydrolase (beta-lactamase superfamily II)